MENSVSLRALHRFWAGGGAVLLLTLLVFPLSCSAADPSAPPETAQSLERRLHILISNDDGVDAPGIIALVRELSKIATVTVAAPAQNASGASHGMTFTDPIFVSESVKDGVRWFGIRATPATCVRLALESLLAEKPDFVLTGINKGENLGLVTYYSATLGSAREASFSGIPSVSFNLQSGPIMDYAVAAEFAVAIVRALAKNPIKSGFFLNVNVPNLTKDKIKGAIVVPVDPQPPFERYEKRTTPNGKTYYWNTYKPLVAGPEKTDVWAIRNGYISISPLSIDPTDRAALKALESLKLEGWK